MGSAQSTRVKSHPADKVNANLVANFVGQGIYSVMAIAFVPIYVELLGIESYGLIGFYTLLQISVGILEMAVVPSIAREMARFSSGATSIDLMRDLLKSFFSVTIVIGLVLALLIAALSGWLSNSWLQADDLAPDVVSHCIMLMGCVIAIRLNEAVFRSGLTGLQFQVSYNVVFSIVAIARYAGVVGFLWLFGFSVELFFLWQVLISIGGIIAYGLLLYSKLPSGSRTARFSIAALQSIKTFATGVFLVGMFSALVGQLDKIILSGMIPLEQFGYYAIAASAAATLVILASPFGQAYFPRLVELFTEQAHADLAKTYMRFSRLAGIIICSAGIPLAVFSEAVVFVWSGDQELADHVGPFLRVLAAANVLNAMLLIPFTMQFAAGWTRLALSLWVISFVLLLPGLLILIPMFGAISGAWAWLGLIMIVFLASIEIMHRRLLKNLKYTWYLSAFLIPMIGAAIPCGLLLLIGMTNSRWVDFLLLLAEGAVGLALAAVLTYAVCRLLPDSRAVVHDHQ